MRKTCEQVETHEGSGRVMMIVVINMKCPRCQNEDEKYFFKMGDVIYCRKCVQFSRVSVNESKNESHTNYNPYCTNYTLDFDLSLKQKEIASKLVDNYKNNINSYVNVVCGGGKTELVYDVIIYALSLGHSVCFCVPRKELVRELHKRIQENFKDMAIGVCYGGFKQSLEAQFIICTTHQLYRFENRGFDLMIIDEVDAFPFYGNDVLNAIFNHCVRRNFIKMSATFKEEDIDDGDVLVMNRRYHGYDLPVPKAILVPTFFQKYLLLFLLIFVKRKWIVYVPTIANGEILYAFLKRFITHISFVSSHSLNIPGSIESLKRSEHYILISTTLLERGITIENVHVIVYSGEHSVFDARTLIQIAGRVGRKPNYPSGDIFILCAHRSKEVKKCLKTIRQHNLTA